MYLVLPFKYALCSLTILLLLYYFTLFHILLTNVPMIVNILNIKHIQPSLRSSTKVAKKEIMILIYIIYKNKNNYEEANKA